MYSSCRVKRRTNTEKNESQSLLYDEACLQEGCEAPAEWVTERTNLREVFRDALKETGFACI